MPYYRLVARWQVSTNQFNAAVSEDELRLFFTKKNTVVEVGSDRFITALGRINLKCLTWWWRCWADWPSPLKAWFQVEANGDALLEREENCQSKSTVRRSSSSIHLSITSLRPRYPAAFKTSQIEQRVFICERILFDRMPTVKERAKIFITCSIGVWGVFVCVPFPPDTRRAKAMCMWFTPFDEIVESWSEWIIVWLCWGWVGGYKEKDLNTRLNSSYICSVSKLFFRLLFGLVQIHQILAIKQSH